MALINESNNYIKVKSYTIDYNDENILIIIETFKTKDDRLTPIVFTKSLNESLIISKSNFNISVTKDDFDDTILTNIYLYMKTLDKYSSCDDDI